MIDFQEVIITNDPSPKIHSALRNRRPGARTFLWGRDGGDLEFYRTLARTGIRLYAQGSLREEVEAGTNLSVLPLRDIDARSEAAIIKDLNGRLRTNPGGAVLFCPCNDTHSRMFAPVARHLGEAKFLLADIRPGENAEATLRSLGIDPLIGSIETLRELKPSVVVLGNDWNQAMKGIVAAATSLRIPTVCLQEGCLDFDTDKRMAISDFPMIQGPIMPRYLSRSAYLPTGNPRFDAIGRRDLPAKPCVMINCNFTYGVHEDQREAWVKGAVDSCTSLGLDFFISQHPRDKGMFPDYPVRPSHAGVVHEHLADASILITRFSTLIYEAMLMGRRAVYFNPFGERMRLFNDDRTHGLLKAFTDAELKGAVEKAATEMDSAERERFDQFVALHCGAADGGAAKRVATALQWLGEVGSPMPKRGFFSRLGF
ncbi:hypothetical protein IT570_00870 [Candidatus Sumerlaeota bacterium]|nr:hypothetical protein [Candidatus Sumerlaeota bacterium]